MAYLRNEKETIEVDYPLEKIWATIPEAVKVLEWTIEEKNDDSHKVKVKTKGGFMAYSSSLEIEVKPVDENTARISLNAETPVTTITSIIDFGRTRDRMGQFIEILAKLMEKKDKS
jgi:carbon monoxide dehydrogenase subunit G